MFPLNWDFPFRKKNGEMTTLADSVTSGLTTSDIANNLTTTTDGKVLDARQGKALNDSKLNKSDVANNLTTTTEGKALDARQGKSLSDAIVTLGTTLTNAINGKVNTDDIANNLSTTTGGKVLDARQGQALNDKITELIQTTHKLFNDNTAILYKNGESINAYFYGVPVANVQGVAVIPSEYRPKLNVFGFGMVSIDNTIYLGTVDILTNGVMYFYYASGGGRINAPSGSIVYLTATWSIS